MENRESLLTTAWVGRIVYSIDFIVILRFIKIEYSHIKQTKWNWLGAFCVMTMISSALLAVSRMTGYIPIVCYITFTLIATLAVTKNVCLTFYQIRRLQNSFSIESLNELQSKQYGYNKYTFIILYISGVLLICLFPISEMVSLSPIQIPDIGCMWPLPTKEKQLMLSLFAIWYYIWDWTVLLMYVVRIIQIKRAIKSDNAGKAYYKIKAILTKIISLTICYEVATLTQVVIIMGAKGQRYKIHGVLLSALDILMPVFTIYLMMEHNNDKYLKCLDMLERACCCCCHYVQRVQQHNAVKTGPDAESTIVEDMNVAEKSNDIDVSHKTETNKNAIYRYGMRINRDIHQINNDNNMNQNGDDIKTINCVKEISRSRWMLICLSIFMIKLLIFVVVLVVIISNINI